MTAYEGDHLPSKASRWAPKTALTHANKGERVRIATKAIPQRTTTTNKVGPGKVAPKTQDELKMPTRLNLYEIGLRRSARLCAQGEDQTEVRQTSQPKAHVPFGKTAAKKLLGFFTLFSFVTSINARTMPSNRSSTNATYTDSVMNRLEEVNQHYDDTINHMHFFSYLTDVSTN